MSTIAVYQFKPRAVTTQIRPFVRYYPKDVEGPATNHIGNQQEDDADGHIHRLSVVEIGAEALVVVLQDDIGEVVPISGNDEKIQNAE